jgi:hypothetical protein
MHLGLSQLLARHGDGERLLVGDADREVNLRGV